MTSPRFRRSGLALVSALAVLAFYIGVSAASAQTAPAATSGSVTSGSSNDGSQSLRPVPSPMPITVTPDPTFDPNATGPSSDGVTYLSGSAVTTRHNQLFCMGHRATIVGTSHNDRIYGTSANDVIVGLGGNDQITAGKGDDIVCGDGGQDQVYGLDDRDVLSGGNGADGVYGGIGDDRIYGNAGDDTMSGDEGTDYIYGAHGNDTMFGGVSGGSAPASSRTRGLTGDSFDYMFGGPDSDTMSGGDGNDNMQGQGGDDTMYGDSVDGSCSSPCNDRMVGGPGRDTFFGGEGDDTITGGEGDDVFDGGLGNDTMWGDGGIDAMFGGAGIDAMHGGNDGDLLNGDADNDTMTGDGGIDTLCGGGGFNTLSGGPQDDFLSGDGTNCTFSTASLLKTFSVDDDVLNLIDGGDGDDVCVSPSTALSTQTKSCEFGGFLRLQIVAEGNGNVSSGGAVGALNEFGIDCDGPQPDSGVCAMFFEPAEMPVTVTLTATPSVGYTFNGWSGVPGGQCPGLTNPCTVTLNAGDFVNLLRTITADFVATTFTLNVTHNGPGVVTSSPSGISCGATCTKTFGAGQGVTLTATGQTAVTNWVVTGVTQTGGCGPGQTTCTFTMDADGSVTINTT